MFSIFPCKADKTPLINDWQRLATKDPNQIRAWQELYRNDLKFWSVPTGPGNDLLVLDIDVKDVNGFETLKTRPIPETMSQRTPSGGAHLFFQYPHDGNVYGNKVKFLPGLDVRSGGGYVLFYGADAKPIAPPPVWLLEEARRVEYQHTGTVVKVAPEIAMGIINTSLEAIREAPPGESNNVLNTEAFKIGQLVASQSITKEYAEQILFEAAVARGKPAYEARATIAS